MSCAAKGQLSRAIALYRSIVDYDKSDAHTWLKLAELYKRDGSSDEAADAYVAAAHGYRAKGFAQKAAASFEQVLRLRSGDGAIHMNVAELYVELAQSLDARRHFEAAIVAHKQAGKGAAPIGALERLVELDPSHVKYRYELAQAYRDAEQPREAVQHFMELATMYLRMGETMRALHTLKFCYETQPENTELLALMARGFEAAGRPDKVSAILAERDRLLGTSAAPAVRPPLARGTARRRPTSPQDVQLAKLFSDAIAFMRGGDNDRAVPLLRAVLDNKPDHEAARLALSQLVGDGN